MQQTYTFDARKSFLSQAETSQGELFAEQRSNCLLVHGNHFSKKGSKFWEGIRQAENLTKEQKIRLTNNHIQVVTKVYLNNIMSIAPDVSFVPANKNELRDTKVAQFHNRVWQDAKERYKLKRKRRELAKDFVELGEFWLFLTYDPMAGDFLGYEQLIDEMGQPVVDQAGQPQRTDKPRFTGGFVWKRFHAFNTRTDTTATSPDTRRWVSFREMAEIQSLKSRYAGDEKKSQLIQEGDDRTVKVFDGNTWQDRKGVIQVDYFLVKPCAEYPMGYYWISTDAGDLEEGTLPGGIWPVVYCGFDEVATSDRAYSIIKPLRPYQAECNRVAGHIVQTQLALSWDRILLTGEGSLTPGGSAHGFKAVKLRAGNFEVIPGRTGDQFLPYMNSVIDGLYKVANLELEMQEKPLQTDPYSALFASMREKKRFVIYADKFSEAWKELALLHNRLAKIFLDDETLTKIVGAPEAVNLPEFRQADDMGFQVSADEVTDDLESRMGRQLAINHLLQYAGSNLPPDQVGKLIRMMPYCNDDKAMDEFTLDYDRATNEILALDRGQQPVIRPGDAHPYFIKRLSMRMSQADFASLQPQIQQAYEQVITYREQLQAQTMMAEQSAKNGLIPTGGYFVGIDFYVTDPMAPGKTKRAKMPFDAVVWLLQRLEAQGITQETLAQVDPTQRAQIQQQVNAGSLPPAQQAGGVPQNGMGQQPMPPMADQAGSSMQ
jgi:hypothetical protein